MTDNIIKFIKIFKRPLSYILALAGIALIAGYIWEPYAQAFLLDEFQLDVTKFIPKHKELFGVFLVILGVGLYLFENSSNFTIRGIYHNKTIKDIETNNANEIDKYCKKIKTLHEFLPTAGFAINIKVPIDLEEIHVPLDATINLSGLSDKKFADSFEADAYLKECDSNLEISLIDAFKESKERGKYRGIVILGDPGSGKSTHLKRVLLFTLRKGATQLGLPKDMIPVFLPLRELKDIDAGLSKFIQNQLSNKHLKTSEGFGERLLSRGNLLFLLDGLDEISDIKRRIEVAEWIAEALENLPDCRFIITCRFAGYTENVRLNDRFFEMHIRPFNTEQSEKFIHNWYKIVEKGLAKDKEQAETIAVEKANELISSLTNANFRASRVFELTRNPLLLTNICLVHRFRNKLPDNRSELYDECIKVLLEHWRGAKKLPNIKAKDGYRILQPAALWMHRKEGRTRATEKELVPQMQSAIKAVRWENGDAKQFLQTVRDESGLLTGWSHDEFGFMHLGFQEYLAAREIRSKAFKDPSILIEVASHFGESWWKEVSLLLLTLEDPSLFEPYIREVLKLPQLLNHLSLIDECIVDTAEISVEPFLELFNQTTSNEDAQQWNRQFHALKISFRLDPEAVFSIKEKLLDHPSNEIHNWILRKEAELSQNIFIAEPVGYELVQIPGETFLMGSSKDEDGHQSQEEPVHEVKIDDFYIGRYPVTNKEYGVFLRDNPKINEPRYWADRRYNQPDQPVIGVSKIDAKAFAAWCNLRLPSEAEWEFACRAGTTGQYYSGNGEDNLDKVGWFKSNSENQLHPVGQKEPNNFGLYDMHGNIWEFVEDSWHDNYSKAPSNGIAWVGKNKKNKVIRGGCWHLGCDKARSAFRGKTVPTKSFFKKPEDYNERITSIGFRLARDH